MSDIPNNSIIPVAIEEEVQTSYLNYAMSVIVSRALPDVRDGLKPVHRRILYAMSDMGLWPNTAYKKAGRVVGDVLGKYHPHGDQSIYDALARLAQDFSLRYPLVDGQGNFGSIDGDPPAAMRYTEARLTKLSEEMLRDIDKQTIDFAPNYDESMQEPTILPGALPNLLANGAAGIAVGMATMMAPHNLREIAEAVDYWIAHRDASNEELGRYIQGPDFPTGGIIYGTKGIRSAYQTGRGRIVLRSKIMVDELPSGKPLLIVTEIPYMVNKSIMIARIAELVRNKKIDGIGDLRDESDRDGLRVVIELKRGAMPQVVLNQLFMHTQLQTNFNINALALVNGRPTMLTLADMLRHFVEHRREVVRRRTQFELQKARERAHILEGIRIALDNIEAVIRLIRASKDTATAHAELRRRFELSKAQAQAILDMRLQRLTNLEAQKVIDELAALQKRIGELEALLASEEAILSIVNRETAMVAKKYGDDRRTTIVQTEVESIDIEDMIQREEMVVLISMQGYLKRTSSSAWRLQRRGGKGSSSSNLREHDILQHLFIASTHDYIMVITSAGKAYWLKVHEIPEASRSARGYHVRNLLGVSTDEEITVVVSVERFREDRYIFMATRKGIVKKVSLSRFSHARTRGVQAILLDEGDRLIASMMTSGEDELVLVTRGGLGLRFRENQVRAMGRATRGVRGIRLISGDELAGAVVPTAEETMFIVSEFGQGKRMHFDELSPHNRATRGQRVYTVTKRTGKVAAMLSANNDAEVVATTSRGASVRLPVVQVPIQGRTARGVRIVNIKKEDYIIGVARITGEELE